MLSQFFLYCWRKKKEPPAPPDKNTTFLSLQFSQDFSTVTVLNIELDLISETEKK